MIIITETGCRLRLWKEKKLRGFQEERSPRLPPSSMASDWSKARCRVSNVASCRDPGTGFRWRILFEWNHDAVARLAAYHPSDVAMAGGIVRKHDVAGPEAPYRAVAGLDLNLSGERNHILAPWRRVIIAPMGCRHTAEEDPLHRFKLGYFHPSLKIEFNVDFLKVRFIICAGVNSNDLHELGCRRIDKKKQGTKNADLSSNRSSGSNRSKCST